MIQTVDNYLPLGSVSKSYYFDFDERKTYFNQDARIIKDKLEITLKDFKRKTQSNIFSFFNDSDKINAKNEDDLIISIHKKEEGYHKQTGNYVGKFVWDGLEVNIKSRFSNIFLERMLNFANGIYLDDVSVSGKKTDKELDISKYIIYYMFVQNLEKAFILGLPKEYRSIEHHVMKLRGKIDINRFIKNDIPFQGKVSSTSREQVEVQEILDVLHKAVKIIDKKFNTKNISHIKTHLKQHKSRNYVSNQTINKAIKNRALYNPIFMPYKKVLEYAKYIINGYSFEENQGGNNSTYGFLINVAELFEIYIFKLLEKEFPDWYVASPKIELYDTPKMFYQRKIIPDIVMIKENNVMVFDTKYKRMLYRGRYEKNGGDVDRNDFFQINTYMTYFQNHQTKYNVIAGGLLYPIEKEFNPVISYSENWLGNSNTKFIVDGIDLTGDIESEKNEVYFQELHNREKEFINRIRKLVN